MLSNILLTLYILIVVLVCIRVVLNTTTPSKGLAYLLLIIGLPVFGVILYLSVGLNYRKRKLYQKKLEVDKQAFPELKERRIAYSQKVLDRNRSKLGHFYPLARFLGEMGIVSENNAVRLLINGEEKFPDLIQSLQKAKHHIHVEYYIYEDDTIGNEIADILVAKAKEGVKVRFIYDDFGSKSIRKTIVKRLQKNGVEAYPFNKITFVQFANRLNYRNHRKIFVIDGTIGYAGGINICDKYINQPKNRLFWRDTHLKITGNAVLKLQYTFLTDWNFCAGQQIGFSTEYFPLSQLDTPFGDHFVQIVESGPDSNYPNILYSLIQTILMAKEELLITTPYLIPNTAFLDALKIASLSGVEIQLLVPHESDSRIVNSTSKSFYQELMEAGMRIYTYKKGFVHAKTLVCDGALAMVGTANLDNRSFDLNFEINALVFDQALAGQLKKQFLRDLEVSEEIDLSQWKKRPFHIRFIEKVLHLFSSLM